MQGFLGVGFILRKDIMKYQWETKTTMEKWQGPSKSAEECWVDIDKGREECTLYRFLASFL
jgi:hypothetical protein